MSTHAISKLLKDLKTNLKGENIAVQDIVHVFEERGIAVFLFLFALPAALPMPGLGINLIIALPLLLLSAQLIILRKHIWLPDKMSKKTFKREKLEKWIDAAIPWVQKIEFFVKPRFRFLTHSAAKIIIGMICLLMALFVCIPLPLTNTVPSFAIAVMAIGIIMHDGLAVIAGALIGLFWCIMLVGAVTFLGIEGLEVLKENLNFLK